MSENIVERHPISMQCPECKDVSLSFKSKILFQDMVKYKGTENVGTYVCKKCRHSGMWFDFYIDDPFYAINSFRKNNQQQKLKYNLSRIKQWLSPSPFS